MDKYVHGTLNNYAEFVNDNIHALWGYHLQLRKFNADIVQKHLLTPRQRAEKTLNYRHENFLKKEKSFHMLPEDQYVRVLRRSEYIPATFRYDLNEQVGRIERTMNAINSLSKELESYAKSDRHKTDIDMQAAYKLLEKGEKLFEKINTTAEEIQFTLETASFHFQQPSDENPYVRHRDQLKSLVDNSRQILENVKNGNRQALSGLRNQLLQTIEHIKKEEAVSLQRVRIYGEDVGPDPYIRYDFVLQLAKGIADHSRDYMQADAENSTYAPHGPGYYYYNKRLAFSFNRYGRGIVLQYNKFVDSSKVRLIKMIEAPHWFKVHRLKEDQIQPGTDIEIPIAGAEEIAPPAPTPSSPLEGYASNNLVFLLDVSSSMNTTEKLELLKSSMKHLVSLMRPEDHVAIVKYSGAAQVVLETASSTEKARIFEAIDNLEPGGRSNIETGLRMAYDVLNEAYINQGNNKIILATDGAFETGKKTLKYIDGQASNNRMLSIFFFGKREEPNQKVRLVEMTNKGKGNYSHIKSGNANAIMIEEARRIVGY